MTQNKLTLRNWVIYSTKTHDAELIPYSGIQDTAQCIHLISKSFPRSEASIVMTLTEAVVRPSGVHSQEVYS